MENQQNTTNFGFKKVKVEEKSSLVKGVFDNVAAKYDVMNDLMSGGMHRRWKDKMLSELNFNNLSDETFNFLDVAGGTGDIAFKILKKAKDKGIKFDIKVSDINKEMLEVGKKRAIDKNLFNDLTFKVENGEKLSFKANQFNYYTVAFGIRNFTDIQKGLEEAYRVLKPGGKFICLEFSQVNSLVLSKLYNLYSFNVIPKIGKLVVDDEDSYRYLAESIKKFPNQDKFKEMIKSAGFEDVKYQNLTFGTVAIHTGLKPLANKK